MESCSPKRRATICAVDVVAEVRHLIRSTGRVVTDVVDLRSTNNRVVWLAPSSVVAKISMDHDRAVRELRTVEALVELGAPVVPPQEIGAEQPLRLGGATVTFWRYEPQDDVAELDAAQVAHYLALLHEKLATIESPAPLPSYLDSLRAAALLLDQAGFAHDLDGDDRMLLRRALIDGLHQLAQSAPSEHVLHGSPHRLNILTVDEAPAFIDFETVEIGPLEWDLAHLEQDVADVYPAHVDQGVLERCRVLVSAATATWCWASVDRGPDMRSHAEHHLASVRSAIH